MTCPHPEREQDVCACNDPAEGPERPPRRTVRWTDLATCQALALAPCRHRYDPRATVPNVCLSCGALALVAGS